LLDHNHSLCPKDGWIAVNCKPHLEGIALASLSRQNFNAYCPMIHKRVHHARRVLDVLRPLFPCYLFVQLDPREQSWRPILGTSGVRTVIRFGEHPSLISKEFIDSLKAREVDGVIVRPASPYRVGHQVRLTSGAFHGLAATIIEMDERDRLKVLIDLLNRKVNVTLSTHQVGLP